jgi:hypothetical protein
MLRVQRLELVQRQRRQAGGQGHVDVALDGHADRK